MLVYIKQKTTGYFPPVVNSINGRYGIYAKVNGINYSDKKMLEDGYEFRDASQEEIAELMSDWKNYHIELQKGFQHQKLQDRQDQINVCLTCEPISITPNEYYGNGLTPVTDVCNLSGTKMIEVYQGCGKGTAYIRENRLVAFHYGYEQPNNVPTDCNVVRVEMSCTQVCFL